MKGIFEIHNNTPVIATEERPDETSFYYQANGAYLVHAEYYEAMKDWERQLIDAVSVEETNLFPGYYKVDTIAQPWFNLVTPGQAIEYEGKVIHKIL